MSGRLAAAALAALVGYACPSLAAADDPAREPCGIVSPHAGTNASFVDLRLAFDTAVRPEPARAIVLACGEIDAARDDTERMRGRLDLATALVYRSREAEALPLVDAAIDALQRAGPQASSLLAEALTVRGKARLALRQLDRAAPDLEAARRHELAAGLGQTPLAARTLIGLADAMHQQRRLDEAEHALDEADAILARAGLADGRDAADVLGQRTMVAYERQDFAATLRFADRDIDARRAIGGRDDAEQLDPLATIVAIRSMQGDFQGSIVAAREAQRIFELHPDASVDNQLGILQNLAAAYIDHAQPAEALPIATQALTLSTRQYGAEAPAALRAYLTLGSVYEQLARYSEALRSYERASAIVQPNPDAIPLLRRLRLHLNKATLDLQLGDVEAAGAELTAADRAMADRPQLGYWRGWHARLSCRVAALAEDWAGADAQCAKVIAEYRDVLPPDNEYSFNANVGRCVAQTRGRLPGDACVTVERRLGDGATIHPKSRAFAFTTLADRATVGGAPSSLGDPMTLRVHAVAAAEQMASPDPLWAALASLAAALGDRGDRSLAIFFGKRSVDAIEAMRDHLDDDRARVESAFLSNKLVVYRRLADWMLAEGRAPEAIEVLHLLKREEAHEYMERSDREAGAVPMSYSPRESAYAAALERLGGVTAGSDAAAEIERLTTRRDAKPLTTDERSRLATLLAGAARTESLRTAEVLRFIATERVVKRPRSTSDRTVAPAAGWGATPRASGEADAYLFLAGTRLNLVFASGDRIERTVVEVDPAAVQRRIGDYLASISARDHDASGAAADLYAWLGRPLDAEARTHGVQRIHLWLDGLLRYVPFAALWDGRSYLVERYEFSYMFAARAQARPDVARRAVGSARSNLIAFGVTRAVGGMPALPGVGEELCDIVDGPVSGLAGDDAGCASSGVAHGSLPGSAFANAYFTEARLRAAAASDGPPDDGSAARADRLHVGTHFALRPGNVQRSWLLLGSGERLQLARLQDFDFSSMDLVTLSACQTGMAGGTADDGREIDGLPALIHRRGAKSVVATLWNVEDRSASVLMRTFYEGLGRRDASVPAALRRAQLALLRGTDAARTQPYYWAAYIPSTSAGR